MLFLHILSSIKAYAIVQSRAKKLKKILGNDVKNDAKRVVAS